MEITDKIKMHRIREEFNNVADHKGPGGGGHTHIWPIRVCATEQGMVFKVLSLKQGMQFHY